MKRKHLLAIVVAMIVSLAVVPTVAQSISIGAGGVQLRGRNGQGMHVGRRGVHVNQGVRPTTQGQPSGTVIIQGTPANGQGQVIIDQHGIRTGVVAESSNFIATNQAAFQYQHAAEAAFKRGDVKLAIQSVKRAIRKDKKNALLQLFASHLRFATGDYEQAAAHMESATETLPVSQWNVVIRNVHWLESKKNYEAQLNRLIGYLTAKPESTDARLVYGFHAAFAGQKSVAARQFSAVLKADPEYDLAIRLNKSLVLDSRQTAVSSRSGSQTKSVTIRDSADEVRIDSDTIRINPGRGEDSVLIDGRSGSISIGDGTFIEIK